VQRCQGQPSTWAIAFFSPAWAFGGVGQTTEAKIVEFAQLQFSRRAQAEAFAEDLKKLTDLDLSVVPALYCAAYDVQPPGG
jgi:hypothetical protein